MIALTLYNGAVLAEVFRAGVLALPKGQAEAAFALGLRKTLVVRLILLPQAVKIMLPGDHQPVHRRAQGHRTWLGDRGARA